MTHEEVKTADATPKSEISAAAAAPATERKAEAVILETGSAGSKPRTGNDADVRVASVRTDEMKAVAPAPAPLTRQLRPASLRRKLRLLSTVAEKIPRRLRS